MGKKASAPATPDYTPIIQASEQAAAMQQQTSQAQLDWAKQQYADQAPLTHQYMTSMIANADAQTANAQEATKRYNTEFAPLEDKFVDQASNWNSPARTDQEAGLAKADVAHSFDQARSSATQNLESYGIDPSQTRFGALDLGTRISQAAATAAAGTQSRQQTQATGMALEGEAIGMGRGLQSQTNQSYSGATSSGSSGIGSGLNTISTGANTMGTGTQWGSLSNSSLAGASSALNMGFNNALGSAQLQTQQQGNLMSGIGSIIGGAAGIGSIAGLFKQ